MNSSDLTFNDIKFIEKIKQYEQFNEFETREVIWISGPSGSGKSRRALEIAKSNHGSVYFKDTSKWWDCYDNQETIILDDWRPSKYFRSDVTLRLLGGIPMRGEIKGTSMWNRNCKRIIITCCKEPSEIWRKNHSDEEVLKLTR